MTTQLQAPETVNAMLRAWLQAQPVPFAPGATNIEACCHEAA
jgi:hypothetical protein